MEGGLLRPVKKSRLYTPPEKREAGASLGWSHTGWVDKARGPVPGRLCCAVVSAGGGLAAEGLHGWSGQRRG